MKQKFNKSWKASRQPRKQRKYTAKAPLHLRNKFVSANLSKELRKKHGTRNLPLRKGDTVKVMRGKFSDKKGKVTKVLLKTSKIIIDGIQIKKKDGSKIDVKMEPSNLQILELNLEDKRRLGEQEAPKQLPKEIIVNGIIYVLVSKKTENSIEYQGGHYIPKEKESKSTDKPKAPKEIKPKLKQEIKEKK